MSDAPQYLNVSTDSTERGQQHPTSEALVSRVIEAIADTAGVDPAALDQPLYDVVDPDALAKLFHTLDGSVDGYVAFTYADYRVLIYSDGSVQVYEEA